MVSLKKSSEFDDSENSKREEAEDSQIDPVAAGKLWGLFWRDLVCVVLFTFGVVFGIRECILSCSSPDATGPTPPPNTTAGDLRNISSSYRTFSVHDVRTQVLNAASDQADQREIFDCMIMKLIVMLMIVMMLARFCTCWRSNVPALCPGDLWILLYPSIFIITKKNSQIL